MIDIKKEMEHDLTRIWHGVIRKYAELSKYKKALDVGTASGLSAYTILTSGEGSLISIDIHGGDRAEALLRENNVPLERVTLLQTTSEAFWKENKDTFDFICIDGSHKYPEVLIDAREAWKVLNAGGYIVFDDYNHPRLREDVGKAVDEWAKEAGVTLIKESNKAIAHKDDDDWLNFNTGMPIKVFNAGDEYICESCQ